MHDTAGVAGALQPLGDRLSVRLLVVHNQYECGVVHAFVTEPVGNSDFQTRDYTASVESDIRGRKRHRQLRQACVCLRL